MLILAVLFAACGRASYESDSATGSTDGDDDDSSGSSGDDSSGSSGDGDGDDSSGSSGDGDGDGDDSSGSSGDGDGCGEGSGYRLELKGAPEFRNEVRLTHSQWEHSVRDIFQLSKVTGYSSEFERDAVFTHFSNNELLLIVRNSDDYRIAAQQVAELVVADDPVLAALGGLDQPSSFIQKVGRRAFRRDLSSEELAEFELVWARGATEIDSGDAARDGARLFIEELLQSRDFLYRVEWTEPGKRLSGYELATKLSLLLFDTTPNDELLDAAASGVLDSDEGFSNVVADMLVQDAA